MTEPADLEFLGIRNSGGIIFIPKYLAKNGRNIILFTDSSIDLSEIRKST